MRQPVRAAAPARMPAPSPGGPRLDKNLTETITAPADLTEHAPADLLTEPRRTLFDDLGLSEPVLRAIEEMGYRHPTPIQEQAIPYVLMGRDVLGAAQTGTGKTAGFTLPMLDILSGSRARARMPRSLILEPTRELALQVAENFVQYGKYLKLTHALIIGGESMSDQKDVLMRGVDVLIATPGRLIDMFERGAILLSDVKILVIDEADRMLDMGFIPDVERIVALLPRNRQTLFFSRHAVAGDTAAGRCIPAEPEGNLGFPAGLRGDDDHRRAGAGRRTRQARSVASAGPHSEGAERADLLQSQARCGYPAQVADAA